MQRTFCFEHDDSDWVFPLIEIRTVARRGSTVEVFLKGGANSTVILSNPATAKRTVAILRAGMEEVLEGAARAVGMVASHE